MHICACVWHSLTCLCIKVATCANKSFWFHEEGTGVIHAGGPSLLPGITALSSLVHQEDQQVVGIVSTTEEGTISALSPVIQM